MTVGELRTRMTTEELLAWGAYFELREEQRERDRRAAESKGKSGGGAPRDTRRRTPPAAPAAK
jgi:hypothetical protein